MLSGPIELDDDVDRGLMDNLPFEIKQTTLEMIKVDVGSPLSYDIEGLSTTIRKRLTEGIKNESYNIIEHIHLDAREMKNKDIDSDGFDLGLYEEFVTAYSLLWDLNLSEYLGEDLEKEELEALLSSLVTLGIQDTTIAGNVLDAIKDPNKIESFGPLFDRIRVHIHLQLNHLMDSI